MKIFFRSFIGLFVIVVLGVVILLFVAKTQLPDVVANNLSRKLQVPVQIGDIDFSPKAIEVQKLEIENPKGYRLPIAFAADTIAVRTPLTEYLRQNIVIEEINISNVYLGLEFQSATGTEGNWTVIIKNAEATAAQGAGKETKNKKTVLIRRIILTNIQTDLFYVSEGKRVKHLPVIDRIELYDIGSEGSSALDQIMNSALGEMLKGVFIKQNLKDLFNQLPGNNTLKNALSPFKGLLNALPLEEPMHIHV
ncbi:MAG: AsmA family protein [Rhabdochlamydiaceae bacterium]|jgi:hypothetical protein